MIELPISSIRSACLIAALMLSACEEEKELDLKAPLREVRTIMVETGSGVYTRTLSGTLQSSNLVSYSFKVSGTIDGIEVEVGESVQRGEIIARLDPSTYELEVQRSRASLAESESQSRKAKAEYDRTRKLYETGDSSRSNLDNARASSDSAAASAEAARKSLQIAEQDLSYTNLRSKDDCQIASIPGDSGENVAAGTEVITASCGDGLEVKLNIPESLINSIKKGMPVTATFPAIPEKSYRGIVNEVGVASVSGGTTFPVEILITDADKSGLKSGLSADVSFVIDNRGSDDQALPILPSFAVGEDQDGRFVFSVKATSDGMRVMRVPVEIGNIEQDGIEIISGVSPGMLVVTAGVSVLRDGMEVKVSQE